MTTAKATNITKNLVTIGFPINPEDLNLHGPTERQKFIRRFVKHVSELTGCKVVAEGSDLDKITFRVGTDCVWSKVNNAIDLAIIRYAPRR